MFILSQNISNSHFLQVLLCNRRWSARSSQRWAPPLLPCWRSAKLASQLTCLPYITLTFTSQLHTLIQTTAGKCTNIRLTARCKKEQQRKRRVNPTSRRNVWQFSLNSTKQRVGLLRLRRSRLFFFFRFAGFQSKKKKKIATASDQDE